MNKKTKRYSLIALIAIVPLSIIAVASSVMAACSISIGVRCDSSYGKYETFEGAASISNNESRRVDFTMTITLKDPSGHTLDTDSRSGSLNPGQYNEYPLRVAPPSGGWQPGTYEFCNQVVAFGINGCIYSNRICKGFTGPPDQPDLEITDVWDENGTIYYKIKNMGGQAAGESNTSLTVDGVLITSDYVASIDPLVEVTETFDYSWKCTDINDSIEVCADYTNAVTEYDESNNCRTVILTCSPSIWISPALFNIELLPDVVSNHILTIGNSGNRVLEFNITNESIQSGWPKTTGGFVFPSPALGDIDGDGDIEVVVGSFDKKVYAWHHDGSDVTGWPKTTGDLVHSSPALGDIDGDGDTEIVVGSNDDKVYAWHHDGSDVTGWPKTTGHWVHSSPALGDIDGDGDIEVVVGSWDHKVYAWHHDGSAVTGWPKTTGSVVDSSPALGDIDGDGDIEVVVGSYDHKVYAWHHNGSAVTGWPKTTGGDMDSSPALGDIDGDGDIEVVVGSFDKKVYAWHHNGSAVTGWPKTTGDYVRSSPALGDIDGDGDIEVVVGSNDKKVYAWHHDGSAVTGWPKTTGSMVRSSPALGDIDGDGDIEVVVGSLDKKVYVWDCFGTYDSNNIEWGMFHHDINHTGLYGYVLPGTGGTGSQTALKEGGWLSEDPTNGTVDPGTQASITVTLDTTSLDFGDYYADIIITSNDPDENPQIIPVHLTVGHIDIWGFAADFGRADCIGDCPGDSDGDEDVDGSDLAEFAKNLGLQNP